jgi:hypothetical protein
MLPQPCKNKAVSDHESSSQGRSIDIFITALMASVWSKGLGWLKLEEQFGKTSCSIKAISANSFEPVQLRGERHCDRTGNTKVGNFAFGYSVLAPQRRSEL